MWQIYKSCTGILRFDAYKLCNQVTKKAMLIKKPLQTYLQWLFIYKIKGTINFRIR